MLGYMFLKNANNNNIFDNIKAHKNIVIGDTELLANTDRRVIDNKGKQVVFYSTYHNTHEDKIISFSYIEILENDIYYVLPYVLQ